jgi:hypothetical protein
MSRTEYCLIMALLVVCIGCQVFSGLIIFGVIVL